MLPIKVYRDGELELPQSIMTIGAFDGLHLGHQALINRAKSRAEIYGVPFVVYTFDPPPKVYFQNQSLLTPFAEKEKFLRNMGVDYTIVASFDEHYASRSVGEFLVELRKIHPQEIWVGPNFYFGKGKSGTTQDLNMISKTFEQPVVRCSKGEVISSTRIRKLFQGNEADQAYCLLGRQLTNEQV
ncbi:FAD synthetase family protein [Mammaliicoccus sciuri]